VAEFVWPEVVESGERDGIPVEIVELIHAKCDNLQGTKVRAHCYPESHGKGAAVFMSASGILQASSPSSGCPTLLDSQLT